MRPWRSLDQLPKHLGEPVAERAPGHDSIRPGRLGRPQGLNLNMRPERQHPDASFARSLGTSPETLDQCHGNFELAGPLGFFAGSARGRDFDNQGFYWVRMGRGILGKPGFQHLQGSHWASGQAQGVGSPLDLAGPE